jgi:hypothetical protein
MRPKIGFALGSGAARGWAHIGIIEALAEMGIVPDIVCGTSIGALVGAACVTGQLERLQAPYRPGARRLSPAGCRSERQAGLIEPRLDARRVGRVHEVEAAEAFGDRIGRIDRHQLGPDLPGFIEAPQVSETDTEIGA